MSSYTNIYGQVVYPTQTPYLALTLNANITLDWPDEFQTGNPLLNYHMDVSPTSGGFTLTLPNATLNSVGGPFLLNNPTAFSFSLNKNDGTLLSTITGPSVNYFYLIDNTTQGGTWRQSLWGAGVTAVTSISANVPTSPSSANLTISGVPITTTGTIGFTFAGDLLSLISFNNSVGIAARTAANTWALTTLTGTANQIAVTNGTGVGGNPTFALASTITGINSIAVGNLSISANTITATNANGSLTLESLGTGNVILDPAGTGVIETTENISTHSGKGIEFASADGGIGYTLITAGNMGTTQVTLLWPTAAPAAGEILQYSGANQLQWATAPTVTGATVVNTIPRYINTGGGLGTTSVSIDNSNNITGATSLATTNLSIGAVTANTIASTNTNGAIIFAPNGNGLIQLDNATTIQNGKTLSFYNATNSNYNAFSAASGLASNLTWTLPTADAIVAGAPLVSNAAGVLSFGTTLGLGNPNAVNGKIIFYNSSNGSTWTLQPGITSSNLTFTLPAADGGSNPNGTTTSIPLATNTSGALTFANTGLIYASGTLSSAQILLLNTTPVKLINAPGAGFMIIVQQFGLELIFNTTPYTLGGNVYLVYGATGGGSNYATTRTNIPQTFIQGGASAFITTPGTVNGTTGLTTANTANAQISITCDTQQFTGGNSTLNWYCWYSIVPVT